MTPSEMQDQMEHADVPDIMQFFRWDHLPEHLQAVSRPFEAMAYSLLELPNNAERSTALRKLLESKDCAVRAKLFKGKN